MLNMPTRALNKSVDEIHSGNRRVLVGKKVVFEDVREEEAGKGGLVNNSCFKNVSCSDESSSIGKDSDLSENSSEKSGDCEEVQSSFKGQRPLDAMEALEEVLPIRRGISRFFKGKSKSFASLAEASSIKDIAKPDNAYMRRRRNLLSYNLNWDKTRSSHLRGNGGGISKRLTSSSRTTLALAVAMSNSEMDKQTGDCNSAGGSLPRKDFPTWRSFSLADLQQCTAVAISGSSEIAVNKP